jgi:DNA-binding transcriptional regulator LsrR (DeoR family)
MAAGIRKAPSILAGARAGMFTTLLTDEPTAQAVLALAAAAE